LPFIIHIGSDKRKRKI